MVLLLSEHLGDDLVYRDARCLEHGHHPGNKFAVGGFCILMQAFEDLSDRRDCICQDFSDVTVLARRAWKRVHLSDYEANPLPASPNSSGIRDLGLVVGLVERLGADVRPDLMGYHLIKCPSMASQACSASVSVLNGEPMTFTAGLVR
jgi:hypothetical protein